MTHPVIEAMARAMRPECWEDELMEKFDSIWMSEECDKLRDSATAALRAFVKVPPSIGMVVAALPITMKISDRLCTPDNVWGAMLSQLAKEVKELK